MSQPNDELLHRLDAFNKWLSDVYNEETSLSRLLIDAGFSEAKIERLKREHLGEFLQAILDIMALYPNQYSEGRNMLMVMLIVLHYGLLDGKPQQFWTIGSVVGVGPERIRQLVNNRMDLYRSPHRQAIFQKDVASIAQHLLDKKSSTQE